MRHSTLTVRALQGYNNAQGNDAVLRNKYMHGNYPVPPTSSMSSPSVLCDHLRARELYCGLPAGPRRR